MMGLVSYDHYFCSLMDPGSAVVFLKNHKKGCLLGQDRYNVLVWVYMIV